MNRIWTNESDAYSAASHEEAVSIAVRNHGYTLEDVGIDEEPVPGNVSISVTYPEGCGYAGGARYPSWVDGENEAKVEWVPRDDHGIAMVANVSAPARVWAKHETGMIYSTDW